MPDSTTIAVLRNDAPLIILTIAHESTLAQARADLRRRGLMLESDAFVDSKGYAVPLDAEADWKLEALLARSEEKTIRIKSTEREAKKSLFSRLAEAASKEQPPELPAAPELPKDKGAKLLEEDTRVREIKTPLASVTLGSDALADQSMRTYTRPPSSLTG